MNREVLFLSTDCVPVKGVLRGIIYDLTRRTYYSFPVEYIALLEQKIINVHELLEIYQHDEEREDILRFKDYLLQRDILLDLPPELFEQLPKLGFEYNDPGAITNCIVDYEKDSPYKLKSFIASCTAIGARHFLIRSYKSDFDESEFLEMLDLFDDTPVRSFELLIKYNQHIEDVARHKAESKIRCKSIVLHSAPNAEYIMAKNQSAMGIFALTPQLIIDAHECHNNSEKYMNVNILFYLEALNHHPYFNKKLCIDVHGRLKNCPSHETHFGIYGEVGVEDVVYREDFRKKWNVNRDQIEACQNCEFRYMCSDSRDIIQKPDGTWVHATQCSYNPFSAKWQTEV